MLGRGLIATHWQGGLSSGGTLKHPQQLLVPLGVLTLVLTEHLCAASVSIQPLLPAQLQAWDLWPVLDSHAWLR